MGPAYCKWPWPNFKVMMTQLALEHLFAILILTLQGLNILFSVFAEVILSLLAYIPGLSYIQLKQYMYWACISVLLNDICFS
jgi:hypothetical protein